MTGAGLVLITATLAALPGISFGCYWKSRYHKAKSEVYQEFADTFGGMVRGGMFGGDKKLREAEAKRHSMKLMLCDPLIRDGFAAALEEAEEHWNRVPLIGDPPRAWKIVRV